MRHVSFGRRGAQLWPLVLLLLAACGRATDGEREGSRHEPARAVAQRDRPPVVIVSIDTLRADHLPAYGYRQVDTPAIDALRQQALLFARAYTQVPLTLPSHSSLFSGQLPASHGVRDNLGYRYDGQRWPSLATLFARAGYATGGFVSAYVLRKESGIGSGFDTWDDEVSRQFGDEVGTSRRAGRATVAAASRWLEGVSGRPFFLFVHLYEPHLPYMPPEPFASRYPLAYDAEIATADAAVGDLLATLRRLGVYERAVVVLLADHGEGLNDHGEPEHGILLYRETLQVPLVLKLPGGKAASRIERPVQLVDVFPTLLALAGIEPPANERLAGSSLLAAAPPGRVIYGETYYPRHYGWSELASVIRDRYHYIHGPSPQLFDLVADPGERRDLLREERRTYVELRDLARASLSEPRPPAAGDAEARRRLAALGYVSSAAGAATTARPDPRDRIAAVGRLHDTATMIAEHRAVEAVPVLRRVLAENPEMVYGWQQLGRALEDSGDLEGGLKAYQRALKLSPEVPDPISLAGAGRLLLLLGRNQEARAHAELALAFDAALGHQLLAAAALADGDLAVAEREAGAMQKSGGDPAETLLVLAGLQARQGRLDEAWRSAEQAEEERQRRGASRQMRGLHLVRGDVLARLGRARQAEEEFRAEIAAFPALLQAYSHLAMLYSSAGQGEVGRAVMHRMIDINRGSPAAYAEAVRTLRGLGDAGDADALLRRGRALHPGDPQLQALAE